MSNLVDRVAAVVVEQLRMKPRRLNARHRVVPTVAFPTGHYPDEPWYDPVEEAEVPLIGEAILQYHREHHHRSKTMKYYVDHSIAAFLTASRLHEREPLFVVTREMCKAWRQSMLDGHQPVGQNRRQAGAGTIAKRLASVAHFFSWCVKREWLPANPMRDLELPKRMVAASKQRKTAFSDVELTQIIPALLATPTNDLPRTEWKWASLCLIFSGCRAFEILKLRRQDIRQVEGVWIFDVVFEDVHNRVKNDPSVRIVPIHSQLIQLGFLEWLTTRTTERIFTLIYPKGSTLASMWFSRLLRTLKIKRADNSLHSARYSFIQKCAQAKVYPALARRLTGHGGTDVHSAVYERNMQFSMKDMAEAVELLRWPSPLGRGPATGLMKESIP